MHNEYARMHSPKMRFLIKFNAIDNLFITLAQRRYVNTQREKRWENEKSTCYAPHIAMYTFFVDVTTLELFGILS